MRYGLLKRSARRADTRTVMGRTSRRELLRTQAGFGLIEVMVSAVVVVLVATATVSAIGSAQKQSSRTLARGVTANLAEQDQERMKAMRTANLLNYSATRTVQQDAGRYTVESESHLVQGPDGETVSCTSTGDQNQFLQLTTKVTPPRATKGDPQTIVSLQALPITEYSPTSGTLIVRLVKGDGTPQPSIPVTLTGPDNRSAATNAEGCAIFQFIRGGDYVAVLNTAGYVDDTLAQRREISVTVNPGKISSAPIQRYDRAGSITPIRFNGATTGTATGVTISNGSIPNPSTRTIAAATTTTASGLFPFPAPYKVWAGRCALNNPETWEPNFYVTNATTYGPVIVPAGGSVAANVREPTITPTITVQRLANQTLSALQYYVRQQDADCNTTQHFYGPYSISISGTQASGSSASTYSLTAPRAYPYGRYWICAQVTKSGGTGTNGVYSAAIAAVRNDTFGGRAATVPNIAVGTGTPTTCDQRWTTGSPVPSTALAGP